MGSMSDLDVLIEQMVTEIWGRAYQLDDLRLQLFLGWLTTHSIEMKRTFGDFLDLDRIALRGLITEGQFRLDLMKWLQSIPVNGLLWEYTTVITEIDWWRDLDPYRLKTITTSDVET